VQNCRFLLDTVGTRFGTEITAARPPRLRVVVNLPTASEKRPEDFLQLIRAFYNLPPKAPAQKAEPIKQLEILPPGGRFSGKPCHRWA
jgi:hypothetical protein